MPSSTVRRPSAPPFLAHALGAALLVVSGASSSGAQVTSRSQTFGTDVNAAGTTARDRAPVFFGSAVVAPAGYRGLSVSTGLSDDQNTIRTINGDGDLVQRAFNASVSAVWGATARLTLGAQVGVAYDRYELALPPGPGTGGREESGGSWGGSEVRVHARYLMLDANDGATRLALNASLKGGGIEDGWGTLGLAFAQRLGRVSLHLAPEARLRDPVRGGEPSPIPGAYRIGRSALSLDARAALVTALSRRVSWSVEALGGNVAGSRSALDPRVLELGTGLRLDLGRTLLDLGYRQVGWGTDGTPLVGLKRVVLGTQWRF